MALREEFADFQDVLAGAVAVAPCEKPAVMVAMTPRTGSSHLCTVLAAAVDVPNIEEIFNYRDVVQLFKTMLGVRRFADYVRTLADRGGPCFMFKTCWNDYAPVAPLHRRMFPDLKVIYLDRLDIVAQAVSMFRAETTHRWHIRRTGRLIGQEEVFGEVPKEQIRRSFNPARIREIMTDLQTERLCWRRFFEVQGIQPIRLSYEGFADDVMSGIGYIAEQLDMPANGTIGPEVGYVKLADDISEQWIEQMRDILAAKR